MQKYHCKIGLLKNHSDQISLVNEQYVAETVDTESGEGLAKDESDISYSILCPV
jgi:hypothetical protein